MKKTQKFESAIVHVGPHKTGTSAIQEFIYANRYELLEVDGLFYPGTNKNHGGDVYTMFSNTPEALYSMSTGLESHEEIQRRGRKLLARYSEELENVAARHLLMSGEAISLLEYEELIELRDFLLKYAEKVTVLFWVRSPINWSTSMAQQYVKRGVKSLKELYADPPLFHYRKWISILGDVFGNDSVKVYDFDDAVKNGGPLKVFLKALPISFEWISKAEDRVVNSSLSHYATLLLDSVNRSDVSKRYPGDITPFRNLRGCKFYLPRESVERIKDETTLECQWLKDEYQINYININDTAEGENTLKCDEELLSVATQIHENYQIQRRSSSYSRAEMLFFGGDLTKARAILQKSIKLRDENAHVYRLLSQIELALGELSAALLSVLKALEIVPRHKGFLDLQDQIETRISSVEKE